MSDLPDPQSGDEEIDLEGEETEGDAEGAGPDEDAEGDASDEADADAGVGEAGSAVRPRVVPWVRPVPFWVRHPHVGGFALFVTLVLAGLLLTGCDFPECGVLWPCPR